MSYTKGPWYADSNGAIWRRPISDLYENGGTHAGDHPLARVFRGHHDWENGFPVDANVRIIAAAPDLLEALEALITAVDHSAYGAALSNARKAIARAKGEQA